MSTLPKKKSENVDTTFFSYELGVRSWFEKSSIALVQSSRLKVVIPCSFPTI